MYHPSSPYLISLRETLNWQNTIRIKTIQILHTNMHQIVFVCFAVVALGAYKFAYAEEQTCSQLMASEKLSDGDKRKAQMCQLLDVAEAASGLTTSLVEGLGAILAEHGVTADVETNDLEKRKNDFLRFGKRKHEYLRFGKRKHEYLRFG